MTIVMAQRTSKKQLVCLAKQQLCMCITLFGACPCHYYITIWREKPKTKFYGEGGNDYSKEATISNISI